MRQRVVIGLVAVAVVAGLIYAASTMDLMSMLLSMHSPPEGAH